MRRINGALAVTLGLGLTLANAIADQRVEPPKDTTLSRDTAKEAKEPTATDRTEKKMCLATEAIGMTVKDSSGQVCGRIADFVIDENGRAPYVAVSAANASISGATATGDRKPGTTIRNSPTAELTLVPWNALSFHEAATAGDAYVQIDMAKKDLEAAPTFRHSELADKDNQSKWSSQVMQHYRSRRGTTTDRDDTDRDRIDRTDGNRTQRDAGKRDE